MKKNKYMEKKNNRGEIYPQNALSGMGNSFRNYFFCLHFSYFGIKCLYYFHGGKS